jgi:ribosomal protein L11 methylase PrmA
MKKIKLSHNNIEFISRVGTSDEKTFKEVIVNNVYERKQFKINKGERWVDLGGNVGAFALVALSKGAEVDIYEPDPYNCKMIEENLKLNNYDANIFNKAVVANDKKKMKMYVGNDMHFHFLFVVSHYCFVEYICIIII